MSTDSITEAPADSRTLREMLTDHARLQAVADTFGDLQKEHRQAVTEAAKKAYKEDGTAAVNVPLDGGGTIKASIAVTEDKSVVTAADQFREWVESHDDFGDAHIKIEVTVLPGTEAAILSKIDWAEDTDGKPQAIYTPTGEVVPGVTKIPGGEVRSFTLTGFKGVRDRIIGAMSAEAMSHLLAGPETDAGASLATPDTIESTTVDPA